MRPQRLSQSGKLYVSAVILAGSFAVVVSLYDIYLSPVGKQWFILAALTVISGSATVKLPSIPASLSVSETFVFTAVLLFGPSAGTLTVALDGFIISLWLNRQRKESHRVLFNIAAPALSVWTSAHAFFLLAGGNPLYDRDVNLAEILIPLAVFTALYFFLNSWLIALAVSFETEQPTSSVWRTNFVWLSLNFICGASVAALLTVYPRRSDLAYLGAIVPLLLVLYLTYRTSMARVEDAHKHLNEISEMYLSTIETLAMAVDAKDQVTHGHIRRVQTYAIGLARSLGIADAGLLRAIEAASLLHDMGKLAVPEHILNKPGKLTAAEFTRMKQHANIGADILSSIQFPYPVIPIVRHHHENWDGSGYPDGLRETKIPIGARILAIVDCFDALTSDRPYRPRLTDSDAMDILVARRGTMYDPLIVDLFVRVHREIAPSEEEGAAPVDTVLAQLTRTIAKNVDPLTDQPLAITLPHAAILLTQSLGDVASQLHKATGLTAELRSSVYLDCAAGRLEADLMIYYRYDKSADTLKVAFCEGIASQSQLVSWEIRLGQRLSGWVGSTRRGIAHSDPALDFECLPIPALKTLKSATAVPVISNDDLYGVLCCYSKSDADLGPKRLQALEVVARQLSSLLSDCSSMDGAADVSVDPKWLAKDAGIVVRRDDAPSLPPLTEALASSLRAECTLVPLTNSECLCVWPLSTRLSVDAFIANLSNAIDRHTMNLSVTVHLPGEFGMNHFSYSKASAASVSMSYVQQAPASLTKVAS
jgi:putative nucleotidyltransferase with HDIG domain